jgi:hypothetical protein
MRVVLAVLGFAAAAPGDRPPFYGQTWAFRAHDHLKGIGLDEAKTHTIRDITWQESASKYCDGYDIPTFNHAVAKVSQHHCFKKCGPGGVCSLAAKHDDRTQAKSGCQCQGYNRLYDDASSPALCLDGLAACKKACMDLGEECWGIQMGKGYGKAEGQRCILKTRGCREQLRLSTPTLKGHSKGHFYWKEYTWTTAITDEGKCYLGKDIVVYNDNAYGLNGAYDDKLDNTFANKMYHYHELHKSRVTWQRKGYTVEQAQTATAWTPPAMAARGGCNSKKHDYVMSTLFGYNEWNQEKTCDDVAQWEDNADDDKAYCKQELFRAVCPGNCAVSADQCKASNDRALLQYWRLISNGDKSLDGTISASCSANAGRKDEDDQISDSTAASQEACQKICFDDNDCKQFFYGDGTCRTYSKVGKTVPAVDNSTCAVAATTCSDVCPSSGKATVDFHTHDVRSWVVNEVLNLACPKNCKQPKSTEQRWPMSFRRLSAEPLDPHPDLSRRFLQTFIPGASADARRLLINCVGTSHESVAKCLATKSQWPVQRYSTWQPSDADTLDWAAAHKELDDPLYNNSATDVDMSDQDFKSSNTKMAMQAPVCRDVHACKQQKTETDCKDNENGCVWYEQENGGKGQCGCPRLYDYWGWHTPLAASMKMTCNKQAAYRTAHRFFVPHNNIDFKKKDADVTAETAFTSSAALKTAWDNARQWRCIDMCKATGQAKTAAELTGYSSSGFGADVLALSQEKRDLLCKGYDPLFVTANSDFNTDYGNALCQVREKCEDLCTGFATLYEGASPVTKPQQYQCASIDMHRTKPRCYLNVKYSVELCTADNFKHGKCGTEQAWDDFVIDGNAPKNWAMHNYFDLLIYNRERHRFVTSSLPTFQNSSDSHIVYHFGGSSFGTKETSLGDTYGYDGTVGHDNPIGIQAGSIANNDYSYAPNGIQLCKDITDEAWDAVERGTKPNAKHVLCGSRQACENFVEELVHRQNAYERMPVAGFIYNNRMRSCIVYAHANGDSNVVDTAAGERSTWGLRSKTSDLDQLSWVKYDFEPCLIDVEEGAFQVFDSGCAGFETDATECEKFATAAGKTFVLNENIKAESSGAIQCDSALGRVALKEMECKMFATGASATFGTESSAASPKGCYQSGSLVVFNAHATGAMATGKNNVCKDAQSGMSCKYDDSTGAATSGQVTFAKTPAGTKHVCKPKCGAHVDSGGCGHPTDTSVTASSITAADKPKGCFKEAGAYYFNSQGAGVKYSSTQEPVCDKNGDFMGTYADGALNEAYNGQLYEYKRYGSIRDIVGPIGNPKTFTEEFPPRGNFLNAKMGGFHRIAYRGEAPRLEHKKDASSGIDKDFDNQQKRRSCSAFNFQIDKTIYRSTSSWGTANGPCESHNQTMCAHQGSIKQQKCEWHAASEKCLESTRHRMHTGSTDTDYLDEGTPISVADVFRTHQHQVSWPTIANSFPVYTKERCQALAIANQATFDFDASVLKASTTLATESGRNAAPYAPSGCSSFVGKNIMTEDRYYWKEHDLPVDTTGTEKLWVGQDGPSAAVGHEGTFSAVRDIASFVLKADDCQYLAEAAGVAYRGLLVNVPAADSAERKANYAPAGCSRFFSSTGDSSHDGYWFKVATKTQTAIDFTVAAQRPTVDTLTISHKAYVENNGATVKIAGTFTQIFMKNQYKPFDQTYSACPSVTGEAWESSAMHMLGHYVPLYRARAERSAAVLSAVCRDELRCPVYTTCALTPGRFRDELQKFRGVGSETARADYQAWLADKYATSAAIKTQFSGTEWGKTCTHCKDDYMVQFPKVLLTDYAAEAIIELDTYDYGKQVFRTTPGAGHWRVHEVKRESPSADLTYNVTHATMRLSASNGADLAVNYGRKYALPAGYRPWQTDVMRFEAVVHDQANADNWKHCTDCRVKFSFYSTVRNLRVFRFAKGAKTGVDVAQDPYDALASVKVLQDDGSEIDADQVDAPQTKEECEAVAGGTDKLNVVAAADGAKKPHGCYKFLSDTEHADDAKVYWNSASSSVKFGYTSSPVAGVYVPLKKAGVAALKGMWYVVSAKGQADFVATADANECDAAPTCEKDKDGGRCVNLQPTPYETNHATAGTNFYRCQCKQNYQLMADGQCLYNGAAAQDQQWFLIHHTDDLKFGWKVQNLQFFKKYDGATRQCSDQFGSDINTKFTTEVSDTYPGTGFDKAKMFDDESDGTATAWRSKTNHLDRMKTGGAWILLKFQDAVHHQIECIKLQQGPCAGNKCSKRVAVYRGVPGGCKDPARVCKSDAFKKDTVHFGQPGQPSWTEYNILSTPADYTQLSSFASGAKKSEASDEDKCQVHLDVTCGRKDSQVFGEIMKTYPDTPSACQCQQLCHEQVDEGCQNWKWFVETKKCFLQRSIFEGHAGSSECKRSHRLGSGWWRKTESEDKRWPGWVSGWVIPLVKKVEITQNKAARKLHAITADEKFHITLKGAGLPYSAKDSHDTSGRQRIKVIATDQNCISDKPDQFVHGVGCSYPSVCSPRPKQTEIGHTNATWNNIRIIKGKKTRHYKVCYCSGLCHNAQSWQVAPGVLKLNSQEHMWEACVKDTSVTTREACKGARTQTVTRHDTVILTVARPHFNNDTDIRDSEIKFVRDIHSCVVTGDEKFTANLITDSNTNVPDSYEELRYKVTIAKGVAVGQYYVCLRQNLTDGANTPWTAIPSHDHLFLQVRLANGDSTHTPGLYKNQVISGAAGQTREVVLKGFKLPGVTYDQVKLTNNAKGCNDNANRLQVSKRVSVLAKDAPADQKNAATVSTHDRDHTNGKHYMFFRAFGLNSDGTTISDKIQWQAHDAVQDTSAAELKWKDFPLSISAVANAVPVHSACAFYQKETTDNFGFYVYGGKKATTTGDEATDQMLEFKFSDTAPCKAAANENQCKAAASGYSAAKQVSTTAFTCGPTPAGSRVLTKADCAAAAKAGFGITGAAWKDPEAITALSEVNDATKPKGCFFDTAANTKLYWNQNADATDPTTGTYYPMCHSTQKQRASTCGYTDGKCWTVTGSVMTQAAGTKLGKRYGHSCWSEFDAGTAGTSDQNVTAFVVIGGRTETGATATSYRYNTTDGILKDTSVSATGAYPIKFNNKDLDLFQHACSWSNDPSGTDDDRIVCVGGISQGGSYNQKIYQLKSNIYTSMQVEVIEPKAGWISGAIGHGAKLIYHNASTFHVIGGRVNGRDTTQVITLPQSVIQGTHDATKCRKADNATEAVACCEQMAGAKRGSCADGHWLKWTTEGTNCWNFECYPHDDAAGYVANLAMPKLSGHSVFFANDHANTGFSTLVLIVQGTSQWVLNFGQYAYRSANLELKASKDDEFKFNLQLPDKYAIGLGLKEKMDGEYSLCLCSAPSTGTMGTAKQWYTVFSYNQVAPKTKRIAETELSTASKKDLCQTKCKSGCTGSNCFCEGYDPTADDNTALCLDIKGCRDRCNAEGNCAYFGYYNHRCHLSRSSGANAISGASDLVDADDGKWTTYKKVSGAALPCQNSDNTFTTKIGTVHVTRKAHVGYDFVVTPNKEESIEVSGGPKGNDFGALDLDPLDALRDRIMVIDCSGTCGVSDATSAMKRSADLEPAVNVFTDAPAETEARKDHAEWHARSYREFGGVYCPGNNLKVADSAEPLVKNHQCYAKCSGGCTGAHCHCDGYLRGYDSPSSNALCLPKASCQLLCDLTEGCSGVDMHRSKSRCFLNMNTGNKCTTYASVSASPDASSERLAPDANYDFYMKVIDDNTKRRLEGRQLVAAKDMGQSWGQLLRFRGITMTKGGTYKVCFCDSKGTGEHACHDKADYKVEIGKLHASGLQCLVSDTRFQRGTCQKQFYGGLRCYTDTASALGRQLLPDMPSHVMSVPNAKPTQASGVQAFREFCRNAHWAGGLWAHGKNATMQSACQKFQAIDTSASGAGGDSTR